ncbi:MAG: radical SAM protein [Nanoarchaeota archaeon]
MVRVLFIYHNEIEESFMPLSLAYLGGAAKKEGVETRLFDTSFWRDVNSDVGESDRQVRERTGEYKRVEGYNPQRETVNINEKFMQAVEEFRPDLLAATSTSYEFRSLVDMVSEVKRRFNIPLIVGGPHPTVAPMKSLESPEVDMICIGEGEAAFAELLKRMKQKKDYSDIPNLWIRTPEGHIVKNGLGALMNMDDLPEPDWDLFNEKHRQRPFEGKLMNYGFFEQSRGCPNKCSYCINAGKTAIYRESGIDTRGFRFHTPEEAVGRIEKYKARYNFNHVTFIDDNLPVMPLEDLTRLAELYKEKVGVKFFAMSRPEPLVSNPRKVEILAEMGCKMIALGAESGNEQLRRDILNRPMKSAVLEKASEIIKDNGIKVCLFNILGFPTETLEMIFETVELNRRIQPDSHSVRFLHPYPGTAIREYCLSRGYIELDYEENRKASFLVEPVLNLPSPPHPTKQQLMHIKNNFGKYIKMPKAEYEKARAEQLKTS